MSISEIKEEIKNMELGELNEVAALILQLRRAKDPNRKEELSNLVEEDGWVKWDRSE